MFLKFLLNINIILNSKAKFIFVKKLSTVMNLSLTPPWSNFYKFFSVGVTARFTVYYKKNF